MLRVLYACLVLLTASAQAATDEQIAQYLKYIGSNPQQLIDQLSNSPADANETETDRLLLLAQAHLQLHHLTATEELLAQIQFRNISAQQQGWFGLIEAGLLKDRDGNFPKALDRYQQANLLLAPLSSSQSVRLHIDGLLQQGTLLTEMEKYKDAEDTLKSARQRALGIADNRRIAALNEQLGRLNRANGNFQLAVEYFQSALNLANQVRDPSFSTRLQLYIGQVFRDNGDNSSALRYTHNAAEISKQNQLLELHANSLSELGYIYENQKQYEQAIYYHLLSIDTLTQVSSNIALARAQMDLGRCYNHLGDADKALEYLLNAQTVFSQRLHQNYLLTNSQEIAKAYLAKGETKRALNILEPYLEKLEQYSPTHRRQLLLLTSEANLNQNNHQLAWQQLKQYGDIAIVQSNNEAKQALDVLEEQQQQNELQRIKKEKTELKAQLERMERNIYWRVPLISLLILAFGWNLRGRIKSQKHNQALQYQVFHNYDSELPNRTALLESLPSHDGLLLLLQIGNLPHLELEIGSKKFNQLRQQIALRLGHQEGLMELYEVSPGLFALRVEQGLEVNWIESLMRRISNWPLLKQSGGNHIAVGAIELPFQPGSMLHLPAECSLQLVQLALAGANNLVETQSRNVYLMLQPVTLNAPLLKADSIYQSAQKCINNGVIRCNSNVSTTEICWPIDQSESKEPDILKHTVKTDQDAIGA